MTDFTHDATYVLYKQGNAYFLQHQESGYNEQPQFKPDDMTEEEFIEFVRGNIEKVRELFGDPQPVYTYGFGHMNIESEGELV